MRHNRMQKKDWWCLY